MGATVSIIVQPARALEAILTNITSPIASLMHGNKKLKGKLRGSSAVSQMLPRVIRNQLAYQDTTPLYPMILDQPSHHPSKVAQQEDEAIRQAPTRIIDPRSSIEARISDILSSAAIRFNECSSDSGHMCIDELEGFLVFILSFDCNFNGQPLTSEAVTSLVGALLQNIRGCSVETVDWELVSAILSTILATILEYETMMSNEEAGLVYHRDS